MAEEIPEYLKLNAQLATQVQVLQRVVALLVIHAPKEARDVIADDLSRMSRAPTPNFAAETAVKAASGVLKGIEEAFGIAQGYHSRKT